jgi:hypothetical protein
MHFLFNLLRIKGRYMFRELLAHPREALHKRHLVYCMHARNVPSAVCAALPEGELVMLDTCTDP